MKKAKFRPCLTSDQISHIISLCKNDLTKQSLAVICTLAPVLTKIENKSMTPAYIVSNEQTILESFGETDNHERLLLAALDEAAYKKWIKTPELCTLDEKVNALTYLIDNQLATPEQEEEWSDLTMKLIEERIEREKSLGILST